MLRLPAILFGVASIPLIYTMGTRVTSRFEALAGAMLATVAAHHVWFSQNARGYTLLLVLALLGTQLILDGLKTRSRKPWLLFAVASALGAYTHVSMILAVIGQAIAVALYLVAGRRFTVGELKGPATGFIGTAALTIILYLPMLGDVAGFFGAQSMATAHKPVGLGVLDLFRNLYLDFVRTAVFAIGGTVFIVGLVSYWRQSLLIPALFFIPPALVYSATVLLDRPSRPRFFFFIAGFLLLVGVRGVFVIIHFVLERLGKSWAAWERPARWAAVAAMTGLLLFDLSRTYGRPKMDYEGALAYVDASRRPNDIVALRRDRHRFRLHQFLRSRLAAAQGRRPPRLTASGSRRDRPAHLRAPPRSCRSRFAACARDTLPGGAELCRHSPGWGHSRLAMPALALKEAARVI